MNRSNSLWLSTVVVGCLLVASTGRTDDQQPTVPEVDANQAERIDFDKFGLPRRVDPRLESLPIPEFIRSLAGRRVQIRVYMWPKVESEDLPMFSGSPEVRQFYYQRSDGEACISPPELRRAKYIVPILLKEGMTIDWKSERVSKPLLIEGVLDIADDPIEFQFGPYPFYIRDATFMEVDPTEGFGPLCYWGWGC